MTENLLFDNMTALLNKRQIIETSIDSNKEKIAALQAQLNELNEQNVVLVRSKFSVNREIQAEEERQRLERLKIEEERRLRAEMLSMKEVDEEIRKLCEGFEAYDKAHPYQIEDVVSSINAYKAGKRGMLNANDMGMGKTFESAIVLYCMQKLLSETLGRKPKILWLTKKSLVTKESTKKEIARWNPNWKTIQPVDGGSPAQREFVVEFYRDSDMADMFLANYEFVRTTPVAQTMKWDIIVVDEVHKLKGGANSNGPTNIWTSIKNLCVNAEYVLMLSGTPMVNAPEEMWSYLHIFNPEKFPDLKTFKRNFMEYKTIAGEFKLVVDANKLLEQVLKGQMIRRSAAEVGLQIPELNYEVVELERTPAQDEAYKQMQNHFFVWLDEQQDKPLSAMAIIAQLTRLRQINVWPVVNFTRTDENGYEVTETLDIRESSKIDEAMDIIDNAQDQAIIFSTFNEPMYEIQRRCRLKGLRCEIISGSEKHNFDVEAEFQQGRINVLCLNSSMGEGLNLQKNPEHWPGGASYGIFLDLWWSPARNEQCIKRIHRQGSSIPVFIYELQNVPSVDQFIKAKNDEKNEQFNSIMESGEIRPASEWKKLLGG